MATRRRKQGAPKDGASLRVLGYVRVSTEEQGKSGAGLAAQRAALRQACEQRGYELELVEDSGYSAKTLDRPGITAALEELDAGTAGVLMVAKLDRLSRSLLDFAGLMERARQRGWAIIALDLGVDMSTPSGKMMANVLATFAQFERDMAGQRTKDALAAKKAAGVKLGRPPSPEWAAARDGVATRIAARREGGWTWQAIADELNLEGVPTAHNGAMWYANSVRKIALTWQNGVIPKG